MKTKSTLFLLAGLMYYRQINKTITFREITDKEELEKAFRFRYEEYSKTRNRVFLRTNNYNVDIDVFDLHSRHFGLFTASNELIGCIRVVLGRNEFYNTKVYKVGEKYGVYSYEEHSADAINKLDEPDFPFLSYQNLPERVKSKYDSMKRNDESFAEASRLIIREEFRGVRICAFLTECAMMLFTFICSMTEHAIIDCNKDHGKFYEKFGFTSFSNEILYNINGLESRTMILQKSSSSLPLTFKEKFESMAAEYSITGKISRVI